MIDREKLQRVAVVSVPYKPAGQRVAHSLAEWIRVNTDIDVITGSTAEIDLAESGADLVIAVGGDGTVLTTARRMHANPIPTIGVNVGKLGFLAEFSEDDVREWIVGRRDLPMRIQPRIYLECTAQTGRDQTTRYALNDACVQQGLMTRLLRIDLWIDDAHAVEYRSDGLIIATPAGSTAYSLSVGGPIVTPDLAAFIISPVAPHTLTNRPIVIGANQKLRFSFRTSAREMALVIDGHEKIDLMSHSTVTVCCSEKTFPLVSHGQRSYYALLRHKLGWGEKPSYAEF